MITQSKILSVSAAKHKDGVIQSMNVGINIEDVRIQGNNVSVAFSYRVDYADGIAEILVKGEVVAEEKDKRKDIEEAFKKTKMLPPAFAEDVITAISYASTAVGTLAAFAIGVAAPLNLPRARLERAPAGPQKAG